MTILSRDIGRWLSTNPGPLYGPTDENVLHQAHALYMLARRANPQTCPFDKFSQFLANCGYRPDTRMHHDTGEHFVILALPAKSKSF
jgi:hypothetical protein